MKKLNIGTLITAIENKDSEAISKFKKEVVVLNHLSAHKKIEMEEEAMNLIIKLHDSYYSYSPTLRSIVLDLLAIKYFTNIEPSNKENTMVTPDEYDTMMTNNITLQQIISDVKFGKHYKFLRDVEAMLDRECAELNSIGAVLSRKIDKITDAVNIKDITKLINTLPKVINKMQKDGSYDRIEQTLTSLGIENVLNDIKIKKARDKVKK